MHELPVTQNVLDLALHHAEQAGGRRIRDVYLVIGQLSSIVDESVQFYWDLLTEDTLAEGSRLHFRRVPAEFLCEICQSHYPLRGDDFGCPSCGSLQVRLLKGGEFSLEAIEVADEERVHA